MRTFHFVLASADHMRNIDGKTRISTRCVFPDFMRFEHNHSIVGSIFGETSRRTETGIAGADD